MRLTLILCLLFLASCRNTEDADPRVTNGVTLNSNDADFLGNKVDG